MSDQDDAISTHRKALAPMFTAAGRAMTAEHWEEFLSGVTEICVESRVSVPHGIEIRCFATHSDGSVTKLFSDRERVEVKQ